MVKNKYNTKILWNGYSITIYQGGSSYESYFITIDNKGQVIIGPNKKMVAIYVVGVMGIRTLTFLFLFFFSFILFLILLFFFSLLYFPEKIMKKAHDKEVTWQVTWCDVTSLEHGRMVWKMMLGYMEYTWWPWVRSEANMRMKHGL